MTRQAGKMFLHFGVVLALLLAAGVAQGNKPGVFRGAVNKLKQTPVGSKINSFMTKATQRWQQRTAAALISATLICGGITGCGTDNPMSSVSAQDMDLTGDYVAYVNARGELEASEVVADQGDMLIITENFVEMELHQSEVLGIGGGYPPTDDSVKFRKGNHLDAYGDMFADIEYLYGKLGSGFKLNGEFTVVDVALSGGTTASGEEILFYKALPGETIRVLIYADEYSVVDW